MKNIWYAQIGLYSVASLIFHLGCSGSCCNSHENAPAPEKTTDAKTALEPAPDKAEEVAPDKQAVSAVNEPIDDVVNATLVSLAFDKDEVGGVPKTIVLKETAGRGTPAVWKVVANENAPSKPAVFGTVETKNKGRTYNVALAQNSSFKDVEISMQVRSVAGEEDQGGGPIWRAKDADNYYIARWNPLEDNFRIYYVKGGERAQIASIKIKLDPTKWCSMKIIMKGQQIEGWLDGEKRLEVSDETFAEAGMVGLWTKADAATLFDDFTARPAAVE